MSLFEMFDLTGKNAIVTGASSGLGVTFAETLSRAGAGVALTARRTERLGELQKRIEDGGGKAVALPCDVADASQVKAMVADAWDALGRVDILVNNAGTAADGGPVPEKVPDELFEQTVRVNLSGAWYCCREVGSRMLADGRGGSIINIASIAGMSGQQNFPPAYQATKAGLLSLTQNLACSWGDRGVRVNAIAPGWFPSEMTQDFLGAPAFLKRVEQQSALRRVGAPAELAGPLLLLASDASSFMTGANLVVDGGLAASMGAAPLSDEILAMFAEVVPDGLGVPIKPAAE